MKLLPLTAAAVLITASIATAQQGMPGAHFVENWDLDEDGKVTLAEATERRGDVFASFDSDDNGSLSATEYDDFDAAREADMNENGGQKGHGRGQMRKVQEGLTREFNDTDANGEVSLEEFLTRTADWLAIIDRTQDGEITTDDFGQRG
jgi:hypothetical protein